MIRFLLTPIMRPIARRKLAKIDHEYRCITEAIERARKLRKGRVSYLHEKAKENQIERLKWGRWLPQAKAPRIFPATETRTESKGMEHGAQ